MQQQQPNITLDRSTGIQCHECNGVFFDQTNLIRRFSRFELGTTTDQFIPIPVFVCKDCGTPVKEFFPEGMKDIEERFGLKKIFDGQKLL